MAEQGEQRRLAAIFAADMVGYSRLMEADERGTIARQKSHRTELIDPKIAEHRGRIVKLMGDGMLVEFASVVDAVECAIEVQRAMAEREADVPEERRIQYRVGINLGDIVVDGDDIFGDGVNIAARLEEIAEPGGICISGTAYDHLKAKVEAGYEYLGEQQVKNITEPVRVYRALLDPKEAGKVFGTRTLRRSWVTVATLAVLAVLVGAGGYLWWLKPWTPEVEQASLARMAFPLPDEPSIAVLPFDNLSGDPEQDYFSDGITEDLITDLSKFGGLFVIARNSSFKYKGRPVKIRQVAEDLGVRYVLEGSVRREDNRVRITAQLIDATTGGHVWADRYDRDMQDVFSVQNEIVRKIVGIISPIGDGRGKLRQAELSRILRTPTEDLTAYDYFLRGQVHFERFTRDDNTLAREMFDKAIEFDANYARAIAMKASTYIMEYRFQWSESPQDALTQAAHVAHHAVQVDATDEMARRVLAMVHMDNGRHEQAISEYEKALVLNPNEATSIMMYGHTLAMVGQPDKGIKFMKKAIRRNPYHPEWYLEFLAIGYFFTKQYEEAITILLKITNPNPTDYLYLAASYAQVGQIERAKATVQELLNVQPQISLSHQVKRRARKYRIMEYVERFAEGLRKAGLPE